MAVQGELRDVDGDARRVAIPHRHQRKFGICSASRLLCRYPRLFTCSIFCHPCKAAVLLRNSDIDAVYGLLEIVPEHVFRDLLKELLRSANRQIFFDTVAPVLNEQDVRASLAVLLQNINPQHAVQFIDAVSAEKLISVLAAPPAALATLVSGVEPERFDTALIPMLQEPTALIRCKVVPILERMAHPEHLSAILNQADARVLLWILRELEVSCLVELLDSLDPGDLAPGSTLLGLLQEAADDPELVDQKVLPLLRLGKPAAVIPFLRGMTAHQLLALLRRIETENLLLLLENTNAELAVTLCSGPLEDAVRLCTVADGLAKIMHNAPAATAFKHGSNALAKVLNDAKDLVNRGKETRGVSHSESYKFGDVTRGLLSGWSGT